MTTKYNLDEEVYCMYKNTPFKFFVTNIEIKKIEGGSYDIIYTLYESKYINRSDKHRKAKEEEIFNSKKELLDSFL